MYENTQQKCRTCLKNNKTTFPLSKLAIGINPKVTYGQLLKEYTRLECPPDYERLLPQYLCLLCCRELCNLYNFTRQAQYCNNKLVNIISNKLTSFQENFINIKKEKNDVRNEYNSQFYEFRIVNPNAFLKTEILEERTENETPVQYYIEDVDIIEHNESDQNNTTLDYTSNGNSNDESLPSETQTVCPICKKIIDKNINLLTHIRIQHDIKMPRIKPNFLVEQQRQQQFICRKCPSKFIKKTSYQKHLKVKHNGNEKINHKIINCNSCDYTARTYAALNFHKRSKHGSEDDKFKCTFCSYTSLKKFSLLLHVKKSHKELIKTLKADLESNTERQGNSNAANQENSYLVDYKTLSQNNIKTSSNNDSDNDDLSNEMFIRNILNIKKRYTNRKPSRLLPRRCDECGNIYKNLNSLKTHKKQVHISEDKYFLCPNCGKKLKSKANLKIHIKNAHNPESSKFDIDKSLTFPKPKEKRFMCTECSYVCSALTTLKIHINRHHTGEKPYKCDICFKSFIVPYELKIHRYLHTGERPYKCPICSKGFRCNYQMIKHKRIHNNERPYKCKDCDKSFTQSYNLSLHKRVHLKERKLNCKICDRLFENQTLLNMHCINENHHDEVV
ncbi:uncharacterized protein ACRADG_006698 [Cochliomyia hominivorax]